MWQFQICMWYPYRVNTVRMVLFCYHAVKLILWTNSQAAGHYSLSLTHTHTHTHTPTHTHTHTHTHKAASHTHMPQHAPRPALAAAVSINQAPPMQWLLIDALIQSLSTVPKSSECVQSTHLPSLINVFCFYKTNRRGRCSYSLTMMHENQHTEEAEIWLAQSVTWQHNAF